jgi:hypothetical protein
MINSSDIVVLQLGKEICKEFHSNVHYEYKLLIIPELIKFYSVRISYPAINPADFLVKQIINNIDGDRNYFIQVTGKSTGFPLDEKKSIPACLIVDEFLVESIPILMILILIVIVISKIPTSKIVTFIKKSYKA